MRRVEGQVSQCLWYAVRIIPGAEHQRPCACVYPGVY